MDGSNALVISSKQTQPYTITPEFEAHWYANKAEISTYKLKQARYGDYHDGIAELIFVTEPLLKKKQVKPNDYGKGEQVQTLKLNFLKKFGTGIYPYSMMLSTFTPLDQTQGLVKASVSGQEWCGQIFGQINATKEAYNYVSYSYFEEEGDISQKLSKAFSEDEIWSRIRVNYQDLPVGEAKVLPGMYYSRLEQLPLKPEHAVLALEKFDSTATYTITYPERKRSLAITFDLSFPHEILKWEETYADKRAPDKVLTTVATLDRSMNIDYWNYNAGKFKSYRDSLNLLY